MRALGLQRAKDTEMRLEILNLADHGSLVHSFNKLSLTLFSASTALDDGELGDGQDKGGLYPRGAEMH